MSGLVDLQETSLINHWRKKDPSVLPILENMEKRENWTLDDVQDLQKAIVDWGMSLTPEQLESFAENDQDNLLKLLGFMKSTRALFLLHKIEEMVPGSTSDLLREALEQIEDGEGDTRTQKILRDRLVALFRVDLIERIFSEERCEKIKNAVRTTTEKYGGIYG
jgi:hypothetical protein